MLNLLWATTPPPDAPNASMATLGKERKQREISYDGVVEKPALVQKLLEYHSSQRTVGT